MEAYIKYKRIYGKFSSEQLQVQFDELVSGGWDVIYYNESPAVTEKKDNNDPYEFSLAVTMVVGKRQSKIL
jgi:hypothetical protein